MSHWILLQIPGGVIQAAQLLLALTILVFIHEAGHFLAAKLFKMRVNKFYLFFDFLFPLSNVLNFSLFKFKKGETEYGIGWFPLGGYVSIAGMIDETSDGEAMQKPPMPDEYRAKPRWQRFIVLIGGIAMNVLLGWVLYTFIILHYQKEYLPVEQVTEIYPTAIGRELGLQPGDRIVEANGKARERYQDLFSTNMFFGGSLLVERAGEKVKIEIPGTFFKKTMKQRADVFVPMHADVFVDSAVQDMGAAKAGIRTGDQLLGGAVWNDSSKLTDFRNYYEFTDFIASQKKDGKALIAVNRDGEKKMYLCEIDSGGKIGAMVHATDSAYYQYHKYGVLEAMGYAGKEANNAIIVQAVSFGKIFKREVSVRELSGPIGMARMLPTVWSWPKFWSFCALISMALAFMNILPIPVLDGGHIVILLIEGIMGRALSVKAMERIQAAGMIIVLVLMAFVFGNDILKLFGK